MNNTALDMKMKEYKNMQKQLKAKEIEIKEIKENMLKEILIENLSVEFKEDLETILAYGFLDFGSRTKLRYEIFILRNGEKWLYLDDVDMSHIKNIKKFTRKLNKLTILLPREKEYILGQFIKQVPIAIARQEALLLQDKKDSMAGGQFSEEKCYKVLKNEDSKILKSWFKILARELHPDRNRNDGSEMQLLNSIRDKFK